MTIHIQRVTRAFLAGSLLFSVALTACTEKEPEEKAKAQASATSAAAEGATAKEAAEAPEKSSHQLELPEGPIGAVNGVPLDKPQFVEKYTKMTRAFTTREKEIPQNLALRYQQSILKQLVDRELLTQEIKKQGITVPAEALEEGFVEYKQMFRTDENFERYLKTSGSSIETIKSNIEHNIAVTLLLEKSGKLKSDGEEARRYYDENQSRYEVKEQIRASHILLKLAPNADDATAKEAKARAEKIYKEAIAPQADFAELAKKYSEGPTAPRGGDLNYFQRGRMVPEFDKVAFGLKLNEVSKPVRTQFGWHIIQLTDKKAGRMRSFEEVEDSIKKLLRGKSGRQAKSEMLKSLKEQAKIEIFLPGVSLDPAPLNPTADQPEAGSPAAQP